MSDFTPGPWLAVGNAVLARSEHAGGRAIAVTGMTSPPSSGEGEANARLIAAAPELYEALEEIAGTEHQDVCEGNFGAPLSECACHVRLAVDALAKARGEDA